ncbi:MAG TPA: plasmid pRiA4b ORF-3 family protein [Candidatus Saccharimonadales bacterium]|nr:plasmid pRiA4b ORF-3 family protein [Candidatus Saccharimonadales bacterium]
MKKTIFQFKVTIKGITPPVWRRILIPSEATFYELHIAIQDSFAWEDYHLHEFYIGPAWDNNVPRICLPYPDDLNLFDEKEPYNEGETLLSAFFSEKQSKATYVYDLGDSWEHTILLEKTLPFNQTAAYPQVISGKRAGPWEDSGGPCGYQEKIEILKNKNHEYYQEIADLLGVENINELDLEHFDPEEVTFRNAGTELQKLKKYLKINYLD